MQRKQLKAIVQCLLETIPDTRDDDPLLYKEVAKNYFTEVPYFMLDIYELLTKLNYQSIRAIRQWLQKRCDDSIRSRLALWQSIEDIFDIRGKEWNKRHNLGEELRKEYSPTFWDKLDQFTIEDRIIR